MKIAVRTDASAEIGTGHLMRCLTLADALKRAGAEVTFLSAPSTEPWHGLVEAHGHRFVTLPASSARGGNEPNPLVHAGWLPWSQVADAGKAHDALPDLVDWLIVDHYALDWRWEREVARRARRILAIDDIADRRHDVDVLLDHNLQDDTGCRYDGWLADGTVRLIGPRYALLRPEFAAARAKRPRRDGSVRRMIVFMGGTDAAGVTLRALKALSLDDLRVIPIDVVIGGASPHLAAIRQAAKGRENTTLHVDASDVAELFAGADLAIGAGGVAALERCCIGLPTITVSVAANQEPGLAQLAASGAVHHLGRIEDTDEAGIAAAVRGLAAKPQVLNTISEVARSLVDGMGVKRVVAVLCDGKATVTIQRASLSDAAILHAWRNAPAVRAVSLSEDPIPYGQHCQWLEAALADPRCILLIGREGAAAVGSLRYNIAERTATVSIIVATEAQGRGVGRALLAAGEAYLRSVDPTVRQIRAIIKSGNRESVRLFTAAGFAPASEGSAQMIYVKPVGSPAA